MACVRALSGAPGNSMVPGFGHSGFLKGLGFRVLGLPRPSNVVLFW